MAVDKNVSLSIVKSELDKCHCDVDNYGWEISTLDESQLSFRVKMISRIDNEIFIVSFKCDNYKEWPPYIDFIDPISGQEGVKNAYPLNSDGFFHKNILICHPCSRKAYKDFKGPHGDWKPPDWENNSKTGALKNIRAI
ncbi:MAG: hypothetical protein IMZ45_00425, partial [Actinobacteria bacterium]|nr:hypothetical protein [Actinomycetota bacterium]